MNDGQNVLFSFQIYESLLLNPHKFPFISNATTAFAAAVHGNGPKVQCIVVRGVNAEDVQDLRHDLKLKLSGCAAVLT